jgi:hypothetical protein
MKIRYLLMTVLVVASTFDGASFALSRGQTVVQNQPVLVQPQAETRGVGEGAMALTDWIRWSGKFYPLWQSLR